MDIYKYMSFEKFVEMVEEEQLYLTRIDLWEDLYEGSIINRLFENLSMKPLTPNQKELLKNLIFHSLYAQSWCGDKNESDAMWRIYSPNCTGVRIKFDSEEIYKNIEIVNGKGMNQHVYLK